MIWKNEATFWKAIRTQWDKQGVGYTRIESPLSPGFPDILAYPKNKPIRLIELKLSRLLNEKSTVIRNDQFLFHRKLFLKQEIKVLTVTGVQSTGEVLIFQTGLYHTMATPVSKGWKYPNTAIQHYFSSLREVDWSLVLKS